MILQVEKFQDSCKQILGAVDTDSALKNVAFGYDTLELEANGKVLHLNVTNGEYFVSIDLPLDAEETIRAVVDAKLFLSLVSKVTTKTMELTTTDIALVVKANGTYKFPLKYDVDSMIVLPKILVNNPTSTFNVSASTLMSILNNNTREVMSTSITRPVQKLYYVDQEGCLTFTNQSACVNSFALPTTNKILLTQKLVKLFKLFKDGDVKVTLGFEDVGGIAQTRISFEQDNITITSILTNDQSMVSSIPVSAIRGRANKTFDYEVTFDKKDFLESLDRLLLFNNTNSLNKGIGVFEFGPTSVAIFDARKTNNEVVAYAVGELTSTYTCNLDLESIKDILSSVDSQVFTLKFGDNQACVLACGTIKNVISQKVIR